MPYKSALKPQGQHLAGPDGPSIPCWGIRKTDLIFNSRRFTWVILLADVQFPIIDVNFLRLFCLLVDITAGCLVDSASLQSFLIISDLSAAAGRCAYIKLLGSFPEVVNPDKRLPPVTKQKVKHQIRVRDRPPITVKFRRLEAEKLEVEKAEFDQLERDRIIRRSNSPWAWPLHMVWKPDGSWQPCGDYPGLNLVTIPDSYPLPNMMDFGQRCPSAAFSVRWIYAWFTTRSPCTPGTSP